MVYNVRLCTSIHNHCLGRKYASDNSCRHHNNLSSVSEKFKTNGTYFKQVYSRKICVKAMLEFVMRLKLFQLLTSIVLLKTLEPYSFEYLYERIKKKKTLRLFTENNTTRNK